MALSRRAFLKAGSSAAVLLGSGLGRPVVGRAQHSLASLLGRPRGPRLVIVGASFGGVLAGLTVRALLPNVEILLLERAPAFVFAPGVHRHVFGRASLDEITRDYSLLDRPRLRVARTTVLSVDRDRRRVVTADGTADYDYLLLTTGVRLAYEEVPGLADRPVVNLSPYDYSASLRDLRRRIADFRRGHVVVGTPETPYTCPPAPYEYALLWAAHLRQRRLPGHVTLVDPRAQPIPRAVAPGLLRAIEAHKGVLTYEPFTRILAVDPEARQVETEAGTLAFDVLSLVPPNKGARFIHEAGLGDGFVDVDARTFRSTRDERIFAVGDGADTPYAKTAFTAAASGKIAGRHLAAVLGARVGAPGLPSNRCFPLVSPDRALRIEVEWSLQGEETGGPLVTATGTSDSEPRAAYVRARGQLERAILREMFGA